VEETAMQLQSLGYVGVRTGDVDQWATYATRFLGMQLVGESRGTRAFRMDDRKQRLIVNAEAGEGIGFYGWEVADAAALDALAAHLEKSAIPVARGSRALAVERRVADLIVFHDPVGNRLEAFHGAELASDAFKPGRSISGFRTGPLGMGHAVLTAARIDQVMPFYTHILGFRLSDYILRPFTAYFFHLNPRHHSLAFVETGSDGVHHLMVELCYLDDVGQAYDLALHDPERIGATFGRHANDEMTSFYSISPSKFMVEYGWGGRSIDPDSWTPQERSEGPSLWGHDRMWLPPDKREQARAMRIALAEAGGRVPLNVMDGNYLRARDVCPWWNASTAARKSG
jgi:2,3-dihydroxybiphenyl 1,2-dioxygenase